MRFLLIFLVVPAIAHADPGYVTYTETVYRLSCERTMLRMYTKYGSGGKTPQSEETTTVKFCDALVNEITRAKAWNTIDSPAGTGCMDVVKTLTEKSTRYPSKDQLFGELCYSITKKDG